MSRGRRGPPRHHRPCARHAARRAPSLRCDRARGLGSHRGTDAVGDGLLLVGLPPCLVGCLRCQRPRRDARHRSGRCSPRRRSGRDRAPHASPRGGALGRAHPHADAARAGSRADTGRADGHGRLLRSLLPRRLRDDPRGSGRPACRRRSDRRLPGGSGRGRLGRGRPATAALRRPGRRPLGGRIGCARDGERLDAHRGAGGRLPGRDLPGGRRYRRVPRDARQEGAARDPAKGPSRASRRRDPPRGLRRPTRRPGDLHRPAPEALGR